MSSYIYISIYNGEILAAAKTPESALNLGLKFWNTDCKDEDCINKEEIKISKQFLFD